MAKPARFGSAVSFLALTSVLASCASGPERVRDISSFRGKTGGEVGLATRALAALGSSDIPAAIGFAEQAVEHSPQDAGFRGLLGNAYLAAGRFASAEAAFKDSLSIYSNQPKVVLKLALVEIAEGQTDDALTLLDDARDVVDPADYGLALALAGRSSEAVAVLQTAARGQQSDARVRQNLALAYALSGDWANARVVASQDVPADQLDGRIHQWMQLAGPGGASVQVAALIGVKPALSDPGQPVRLALRQPNTRLAEAEPAPQRQPQPQPQPRPVPQPQPRVAVAAAQPAPSAPLARPASAPKPAPVLAAAPNPAPVPPSAPKPAAVAAAAPAKAPVPAPVTIAQAAFAAPDAPAVFAAIAPRLAPPVAVAALNIHFATPVAVAAPNARVSPPIAAAAPNVRVSPPVAAAAPSVRVSQPVAAAAPKARRSPPPVQIAVLKIDHMLPAIHNAALRHGISGAVVQLGAYKSPERVGAAWTILTQRYPALRAYLPLRARFVSPKGTFWRLSISGFDTNRDAVARCLALHSRGGACFVRRAAGDAPVEIASR